MAIKNLYNNLPGHLVEFKDGGFELVSEQTNTKNNKSLLILGTAFDGPVNEPVKIDKTTVTGNNNSTTVHNLISIFSNLHNLTFFFFAIILPSFFYFILI